MKGTVSRIIWGVSLAAFLAARPVGAVRQRKAWVERKDGITVLHVSGTAYEMGHQQGTLLRKEIGEAAEQMWVKPVRAALGPQFDEIKQAVRQVAELCPSYILEEIRGMADGAQVPYEDLLFASLSPDILQNLGVTSRFESMLEGKPGCSNMVAFGRATADGKVYHAFNFDWIKEIGIQKHYQVTAYRPKDGQPFVAIGWTGVLYCTTGINAHGLSTGMVGATNVNKQMVALPMGMMHRRIVQEAESLPQAVAMIGNAKRPSGYNYVLAQPKPPYAIAVETDAKHAVVWYPNDPREKQVEYAIPLTDAIVRSDEALDAAVRNDQTCSNGDPSKPGLEDPRGTESYDHRYKGWCEGQKKYFGALNAEKMIELARAAAIRDASMHNVIYENSARSFYLAVAEGKRDAWQGKYIRFTWKELFP
jgi:predicted choloylglycine hydrolase